MTDSPKVSVCMIAHNEEIFIKEAVESVLAQTFSDFELIVLDDGSTDSTCECVAAIKDPRIRLYSQKQGGRPRARNRAMGYCRGEYIASLDADDTYLPDKLEKQVRFLDENNDIDVVFGNYYRTDKEGNILKAIELPLSYSALQKDLAKRNRFHLNTILARRTVFDSLSGYNEKYLIGQDYELFIRMLKEFRVESIPSVVATRRIHESNIIWNEYKKSLGVSIDCQKKAVAAFNLPLSYYLYLLKPVTLRALPDGIEAVIRKIIFNNK